MNTVNIAFTVMLLNISGCAIMSSNARNDAPETELVAGVSEVNASEIAANYSLLGRSRSQAGKQLASIETNYDKNSKGRAHNIELAAKKLNGFIIEPDAVFSFNGALGKTGKAEGYKKARIFVLGKDAEGYGGGICQLSSSIYGCALDMGLEIIERHPHSKEVKYVPKDRDAATSYGGKDLKIRNTYGKALKISAFAKDGTLNVSIS